MGVRGGVWSGSCISSIVNPTHPNILYENNAVWVGRLQLPCPRVMASCRGNADGVYLNAVKLLSGKLLCRALVNVVELLSYISLSDNVLRWSSYPWFGLRKESPKRYINAWRCFRADEEQRVWISHSLFLYNLLLPLPFGTKLTLSPYGMVYNLIQTFGNQCLSFGECV